MNKPGGAAQAVALLLALLQNAEPDVKSGYSGNQKSQEGDVRDS